MGRSSNDDRSDAMNPNNDAHWADQANRYGTDTDDDDDASAYQADEGQEGQDDSIICYRCLTHIEHAVQEELLAVGWVHRWPYAGAVGWNCPACMKLASPPMKSLPALNPSGMPSTTELASPGQALGMAIALRRRALLRRDR